MSKNENKTKPEAQDVGLYLQSVEPPQRREDSMALHRLMQETTGQPGVMWGTSMIGYGSYHYRYDSGREGDWFVVGFAPRKQSLTLYMMQQAVHEAPELLKNLGKYKMGKGCIYIQRLSDIHMEVLQNLIRLSVDAAPKT